MAEQITKFQNDKFDPIDFNYDEAVNKQLCAVVDSDDNVIGTGVVVLQSSSYLEITIDGVKYVFDAYGYPRSNNAAGYTLKMAESRVDPVSAGSVVSGSTKYTRTYNAETGEMEYEADPNSSYQMTIDTLNARDQFAIQVLRGIMDNLESPETKGQNEISYYCDVAYKWAAYMMAESSKARALIKDEDESSIAHAENIGYLADNTEKLLNNIVAAIEKLSAKTEANKPESLSTIVTKLDAIQQNLTAMTTGLVDALSAITTAIDNLKLSPTINNNITVPETNNQGGE